MIVPQVSEFSTLLKLHQIQTDTAQPTSDYAMKDYKQYEAAIEN